MTQITRIAVSSSPIRAIRVTPRLQHPQVGAGVRELSLVIFCGKPRRVRLRDQQHLAGRLPARQRDMGRSRLRQRIRCANAYP